MRVPETPLAFLSRSARMFGDRVAMIDGGRSWSYRELDRRAAAGARVLKDLDVRPGDRVAVLAPNTPMMLEAHYSVPRAGAVLVALNYRLLGKDLALIAEHAQVRLLLHDDGLGELAAELGVRSISAREYERAVDAVDAAGGGLERPVEDEGALLAINYTSGTTGRPKGAMFEHRGAYLQALAMAYHSRMSTASVHLWTLPMFHCHGWCFTWAVTAAGATHVCLPSVEPGEIWRLIRERGVTHCNAAPTVLAGMANHPAAAPIDRPEPLRIGTGGAPPSPALLERLAELNIDVTHLYGLTETYGPVVASDWHPEWDALPPEERARRKARQGNVNILSGELRIVTESGADAPADGATIGEVALRGNNVMRGYFRDPEATREAIPDGWLRTGDLGVLHPDGYLELRDRAKDIIISGGENIASIEVEQVLQSHPDVLEAAVVGMTDDYWGEVPAAFVDLKPGRSASEEQLIGFARDALPHFKAPKRVLLGPLPKTATGKVQKFVLRERLREPA